MWTLSHQYSQNVKDTSFGCRLNQIQLEFENFLLTLKNNGAEILFIFKRSQYKETDFIADYERHYKDGCEALDVIETFKSTETIVRHFQNRFQQRGSEFEIPLNHSVLMVFAQTAEKHGSMLGIDKGEFKPSTFHVQLANNNHAMALMGTDTYYIFHKGSWKFWADKTLDMKNMTVKEFNKEFILQRLGVTFEKAPLFVALAGGLDSTEENLRKIAIFFNTRNARDLILKVAAYVRRQRFPINDQSLNAIVQDIFGRSDPEVLESFRRTLDLMNPDFLPKVPLVTVDQDIKKIFESEYLNFGDQLLNNRAIYISSVFMDLR